MNVCPIGPEWNQFVSDLSLLNNKLTEADALTAFDLYNIENNTIGEIPSLTTAMSIFNNLSIIEKDEQLAKASNLSKKRQFNSQKELISKIYDSANGKQKQTLDKIYEMTDKHINFLDANLEKLKTISVSNFIGSSEFKGDPLEYEAFKLFGIYIHKVLEDVQLEALDTNKSAGNIFTKEYFENSLSSFKEKTPFKIESLDDDRLYLIAKDIVEHLSVLKRSGYLIIPEISVIGTDTYGTKVIGRIDMLLIDPTGAVKIYDFKTKKVDMSKYASSWEEDNTSDILTELALRQYPMAKNQPVGNQQAFVTGDFQKRSAYDSWAMQTNIYKNILKQSGIPVSGHTILSLLYETDKEKKFIGNTVHEFALENYYLYSDTSTELDENGVLVYAHAKLDTRVDKIKDLVNTYVPVKKQKEEVKKKSILFDEFIQPTDEDYVQMRANIKLNIDKELTSIIAEKNNPKTPIGIKNILTSRIETLIKYKDIVERMNNEDFDHSINFAKVLDNLYEELNFLNNSAISLVDKYENNHSFFNATDYKKINLINNQAQGLNDIINIMHKTLNEARDNPNNPIKENSPVLNRMGTILGYKESIRLAKHKINRKNSAQLLMTPGKKVFDRINEDLSEIVLKEIEVLEKEIDELKSGKGLTFNQQMKSKVLSVISKSYKSKLEEKLGPDAPKLALIEEKEKQIKDFKSLINGTLNYSEEGVLNYLDNITNPDSTFYVGSDKVLPYTQLIQGLKTNEYLATVANKDLAMSATTQFLKNTLALAVSNAQNQFASSNFDKLREKLYRDGRSFEKINQSITEKRTIKYIDTDTKELVEKEISTLIVPYTQEYSEKWNSYKTSLKNFDYHIYLLKKERNEKFSKSKKGSSQEIEDVTKRLKDLQDERANSIKEHNKWMVENCSLPYIDEFYTLQRDLPDDIASDLQDKYLELETYRFFLDGKTEDLEIQDDFEFDRIAEIEDEIRVLRSKAREVSPEYDNYIKRLGEFYEFDIKQSAYNIQKSHAEAKFEGNPEKMEQWMRDNSITRPTKEWYEKLGSLYDQLGEYFSSDPVLTNMFEQRNIILRKHKVSGVLMPQFMSDDDIQDYDDIQNEIDTYLDSKKSEKLADHDQEQVNQIMSEINDIKSLELNSEYKRNFDNKIKKLRAALRLVSDQRSYVAIISTNNSSKEEQDSEKEKLLKYEKNFGVIEKEFKEWYNKNHDSKYKSITTGYMIESFSNPKKFNYQNMPAENVKEQYMETVPHPKYTKKSMKKDKYFIDGVQLNEEDTENLEKNPKDIQILINEGRLVIEPGVYNKNFLLSPDGIPMPKNIIKLSDNVYVPALGQGTQNINPKYIELFKDKDLFDFYSAITSMYFDLQKRIDGKINGYTVPGAVSSFVESLHTSSLSEAIKKQKDIFVDKNIRAYGSAQDLNDNTFGDLGASIRLKGNNQLSELLQSKDTVSTIMQWCAEAHVNIAMQEAAPVVDSFIDDLKSKALELQEKLQKGDRGIVKDITGNVISSIDYNKRLKELTSVISQIEYERNKFISGKYEDPYSASRKVTKNINNFFRYTSFIRIGFDVVNQTKNLVAGTVQSLIAACDTANGHYGKEDFLFAKAKIFGFGNNSVLGNYLKDMGNISDISDTTMLYRLFNPVQKEFQKYVRDMSGKVSRKVLAKTLNINELGFFLQDKGDTLIGMTVMWSVLNNYKYRVIKSYNLEGEAEYEKDKNGNDLYIPAYDCYIRDNDNQLVIRNDVEYTKSDENFLRNIVYSEMRRAQGNYAKADQVKAESTIEGKMVLFFRKYLIPMFMNRFGYVKTNWEGGEVAAGYWRMIGTAVRHYGIKEVAKHMLIGGKSMNRLNKNTMGKFMTAKVDQARRDAMVMVLLSILSMMALTYIKKKDDDDEEIGLVEGNLIRLLWQVKGETNSMFPVGEGSSEYIRNFTTGIPLVREFTALIKFINHGYSYGTAMLMNGGEEPDPELDSAYYQDLWKNAYYARKAGSYEKGDPKIIKDFVDLTGVRNFRDLLQPENRIDILKRNQ